MKKGISVILLVVLLVFIMISGLRLMNREVTNNDEGIYLTTFMLANKGYKLYNQIFFSQPPGFFLAVYPGFLLLGKSIAATRMTVFLWSVVGLFGIIWLGFELKNLFFPLIAILILYSIPTYLIQTLTLQSDVISVVFSLLTFISLHRYNITKRIRWIAIAGILFSLAFWTKFDISTLSVVVLTILITEKGKIKSICLFLTSYSLASLAIIFPYGLRNIWENVIRYRLEAASQYTYTSENLFHLIMQDSFVMILFVLALLLGFLIKSKMTTVVKLTWLWSLTSLFLLLIYKPLFLHHLVILIIPAVILLALELFSFQSNYHGKFLTSAIVMLWIMSFLFNQVYLQSNNPSTILSTEQYKAVQIIRSNSGYNDFILSDEAILNSASGRLPPPELVDLSYVRLHSGNLSLDRLKKEIDDYHPKMIISWNGRLQSVNGFSNLLKNYILKTAIDKNKKIYILK